MVGSYKKEEVTIHSCRTPKDDNKSIPGSGVSWHVKDTALLWSRAHFSYEIPLSVSEKDSQYWLKPLSL